MKSVLIRSVSLCLAVFAVGGSVMADEVFREVLTSTEQSVNVEVWAASSRELTPDCPHDWSITKDVLQGGRQEGVDIVTIDNGRMKIVVCPTRGMGILNVTMDDLQLKWDSPVKEVVHPKFINLSSRGGLGWLEGFNEFMCRCGLENNGHPGIDKFVNNVGDEAEMELTLHGKIANIPASNISVEIQQTAPYTIRLKGQVNERFLFGPKLELETELEIVPGRPTFRLKDTVRNTGAQDQEFQLLYHANFGRPLLEAGAEVLVAANEVVPFNDRAAEGLEDWHTYEGPTAGFVEQVYLLNPKGDHKHNTTALIHNKSKTRGVSLSWNLKQLPYLTIWKNTGAVQDGYVTGIEPGTNYPNTRRVEREAGRVPKLKPGEARTMILTFDLHNDLRAVENAIQSVNLLNVSGQPLDSGPATQPLQ